MKKGKNESHVVIRCGRKMNYEVEEGYMIKVKKGRDKKWKKEKRWRRKRTRKTKWRKKE